ncbi:hypothetical protein FACS1894181_15110 [Bacteroidia bacterium]|nr:hypothetical protein FACS1894181_15110 [Bacteroidia bacterium]
MKQVIVILFLLQASIVWIQAKEYFVSLSGSGSNTGSIGRPFADIAQASEVAQAGDTVTLRGGVYLPDKPFTPRHSGQGGKWILYRSMPGEKALFDGSNLFYAQEGKETILFSLATQGIFQIENVSYVRFENIGVANSRAAGFIVRGPGTKQVELDGCSADRTYNSGIGLWYADSVRVFRCGVTRANDANYRNEGVEKPGEAPHEAISICGARFFEVAFNHVHHCYKEGIDCKEVSCHGYIHHNRVHDIPRQAYYTDAWFGLLEDVEWYGNLAYDCAWGFAISVEGKDSEVRNIRFHHNILYNMKGAGILFGVWGEDRLRSDIHIYNNTLYKCGSPHWFSGGVGSIDILSKNFRDVYIYRNICDKGWDYEMGFSFLPEETGQALKERNFVATENLFESAKNRPSRTGQYEYHVYEYLPEGNTFGAPLYMNELEYDLTPEMIPPANTASPVKWKYPPSPLAGARHIEHVPFQKSHRLVQGDACLDGFHFKFFGREAIGQVHGYVSPVPFGPSFFPKIACYFRYAVDFCF